MVNAFNYNEVSDLYIYVIPVFPLKNVFGTMLSCDCWVSVSRIAAMSQT